MDSVNFLTTVGIFSKLQPSTLEPLASKLRRRTYQRGEVIFHQDDPGDRLHFVADGMVKISITSQDGRENDIALLSQGDCFRRDVSPQRGIEVGYSYCRGAHGNHDPAG